MKNKEIIEHFLKELFALKHDIYIDEDNIENFTDLMKDYLSESQMWIFKMTMLVEITTGNKRRYFSKDKVREMIDHILEMGIIEMRFCDALQKKLPINITNYGEQGRLRRISLEGTEIWKIGLTDYYWEYSGYKKRMVTAEERFYLYNLGHVSLL